MTDTSQNELATEVLAKRAISLEPTIEKKFEEARTAVGELARLLEELRILQGAISSLNGEKVFLEPESLPSVRARDPLSRVQRVQRDLDMVDRIRREPEQRPFADPDQLPRRELARMRQRPGNDFDVVAEARSVALEGNGHVNLHKLAGQIVVKVPGRYRNVTTAQASLYYHLGKSEEFEKVGPGLFRMKGEAGKQGEETQ